MFNHALGSYLGFPKDADIIIAARPDKACAAVMSVTDAIDDTALFPVCLNKLFRQPSMHYQR